MANAIEVIKNVKHSFRLSDLVETDKRDSLLLYLRELRQVVHRQSKMDIT